MHNPKQLDLFDYSYNEPKTTELKIAEYLEPETKLEKATFIQRGIAFFIDIVIIETLMSSIWSILKPSFVFLTTSFISSDKLENAQIIFLVLTEAFLFLWYFSTLTVLYGFTLGKFVTNIRVIGANYNQANIKSSILRHLPCFMVFVLFLGFSFSTLKPLFYLTSYFMLIDFFLPLFRKDKKTLHDLFSKTIVIKSKCSH